LLLVPHIPNILHQRGKLLIPSGEYNLQIIAESRSNEAFVALCLLTVGGSGLLTKMLGLSDTLGAFIAGVLLAETSFRTQVCVCVFVWCAAV
jgi:Kef-type K+ transport system membrane component KefB